MLWRHPYYASPETLLIRVNLKKKNLNVFKRKLYEKITIFCSNHCYGSSLHEGGNF